MCYFFCTLVLSVVTNFSFYVQLADLKQKMKRNQNHQNLSSGAKIENNNKINIKKFLFLAKCIWIRTLTINKKLS